MENQAQKQLEQEVAEMEANIKEYLKKANREVKKLHNMVGFQVLVVFTTDITEYKEHKFLDNQQIMVKGELHYASLPEYGEDFYLLAEPLVVDKARQDRETQVTASFYENQFVWFDKQYKSVDGLPVIIINLKTWGEKAPWRLEY